MAGTYGGSFLYHLDDNQVAVGFVVGLDYENPWLSPFDEIQRFKTHPAIRATSSRVANASPMAPAPSTRAVSSRFHEAHLPRWHADRLCEAGFLNTPKIKGSHTAMKSPA